MDRNGLSTVLLLKIEEEDDDEDEEEKMAVGLAHSKRMARFLVPMRLTVIKPPGISAAGDSPQQTHGASEGKRLPLKAI